MGWKIGSMLKKKPDIPSAMEVFNHLKDCKGINPHADLDTRTGLGEESYRDLMFGEPSPYYIKVSICPPKDKERLYHPKDKKWRERKYVRLIAEVSIDSEEGFDGSISYVDEVLRELYPQGVQDSYNTPAPSKTAGVVWSSGPLNIYVADLEDVEKLCKEAEKVLKGLNKVGTKAQLSKLSKIEKSEKKIENYKKQIYNEVLAKMRGST